MTAICKTCGGTQGKHMPSVLDSQGSGNPGHKISNKATIKAIGYFINGYPTGWIIEGSPSGTIIDDNNRVVSFGGWDIRDLEIISEIHHRPDLQIVINQITGDLLSIDQLQDHIRSTAEQVAMEVIDLPWDGHTWAQDAYWKGQQDLRRYQRQALPGILDEVMGNKNEPQATPEAPDTTESVPE